jgi:glucose/arabinose dehydrogenase/cytochrome c2
MKYVITLTMLGCVFSCAAAPGALAADAAAGKQIFQQRCAICHSAEPGDNGGAQGPSLIGVFGRRAATSAFAYTSALKGSGLTWNAAGLNRFLAAPGEVVPGTSMVVAVPQAADRDNLIAYFQSVQGAKAVTSAAPIPAISTQTANWREDAPGRVHHIDSKNLPAPFTTPSSTNHTSMVSQPANATLALPVGFEIKPFFTDLSGPRRMVEAGDGDIFVTETFGGRVAALRLDKKGVPHKSVFAQGLRQPFGLAFYPNAEAPKWLYVAETHRVVRYPFHDGDLKAGGAAEIVIADLPSGSGHFTRDLAFSRDGKQLFVSVGSASNVAEKMSKKAPVDVAAWEKAHGLGAAWDEESNRATVLVFEAAAPAAPVIYASGIRNCVGLTVQPANGALWCTTNERDALGDDLVPDYSTRVSKGDFYGWPWYYIGSNEDPRLKGDRPDLAGKVKVPDVLYQSHSASLTMMFYRAGNGSAAFPKDYDGDAIVALHGSWNRSLRTGYKLVRVRMKNGEPTGEYEDFMTGYIVDNDSVWGRPVAALELKDGSLLVSEDGNNTIMRIAYKH